MIITNKRLNARKVLRYHNGRGAQEGIFAELISRRPRWTMFRPEDKRESGVLYWQRCWCITSTGKCRCSPTNSNALPLNDVHRWHFTRLGTLRRQLIQRAGRLTRPQRDLDFDDER